MSNRHWEQVCGLHLTERLGISVTALRHRSPRALSVQLTRPAGTLRVQLWVGTGNVSLSWDRMDSF